MGAPAGLPFNVKAPVTINTILHDEPIVASITVCNYKGCAPGLTPKSFITRIAALWPADPITEPAG
jgi:hypothetical protein